MKIGVEMNAVTAWLRLSSTESSRERNHQGTLQHLQTEVREWLFSDAIWTRRKIILNEKLHRNISSTSLAIFPPWASCDSNTWWGSNASIIMGNFFVCICIIYDFFSSAITSIPFFFPCLLPLKHTFLLMMETPVPAPLPQFTLGPHMLSSNGMKDFLSKD